MGYDPFATTGSGGVQAPAGGAPTEGGALVSDIYARQLKRYLPNFANIPDADVPRVIRNILALPPERKARFFQDVRQYVPRFQKQGNPEQEFTRLFAPQAAVPLAQRDPIDVVVEEAMAGRGGSTWGMGISDLVPPQFPTPQRSNIDATAGAAAGRPPAASMPAPVRPAAPMPAHESSRPTAIRPLGSDPAQTLFKMLTTAQRVEADTEPNPDPVSRLVEERQAKTGDALDRLKEKRALGAGLEQSRQERLARALAGGTQYPPMGSNTLEAMRTGGDPAQWQTMPGEIQVLPEMTVTGDPTSVLPAIQAPLDEAGIQQMAPIAADMSARAQAEADAARKKDLDEMDQLIGALETGVYAPILGAGMPIAEGVHKAASAIPRYWEALKAGNEGEKARAAMDIILGAGGAAISSVPMVAGVNAAAPLTTAAGGRVGEVLGGEQGRKIGEKIGEYAPMLSFGARGLALMGGAMVAGEGTRELLSMPWAQSIPEEDKERLIEAAGHAGFLAGMAGMRYKNAAARKLFVKEVEQNYTPAQLRDIYLRVNRGEGTPAEEAFTRALNTEMGKDIGQAVRTGVKVSSEAYRRGTPGWLQRMAGPVLEGERISMSKGAAVNPAATAPTAGEPGTGPVSDATRVPQLIGPNILPPDVPVATKPVAPETGVTPAGIPPQLAPFFSGQGPGPVEATPAPASAPPAGLPPQLAQFFQQMTFPQRMPKPEVPKKPEAPKQLPAMNRDQMRKFMAAQTDILQRAQIPEEDIPDYAQDSLADGKKLRSYAEEVIAGQMTPEAAAARVRSDYDAMISGRKNAPNLEAAGSVAPRISAEQGIGDRGGVEPLDLSGLEVGRKPSAGMAEDVRFETETGYIEGGYGTSVPDDTGEPITVSKPGLFITDAGLKEGVEKGKGHGQKLYLDAMKKYGRLYSGFPRSEDADRVHDALERKGLATFRQEGDFTVIEPTGKAISQPQPSSAQPRRSEGGPMDLGDIVGKLPDAKPEQFKSGKWGFGPGRVPVELKYRRADGQPLTEQDIDSIARFGPGSTVDGKYRTRVWDSEAEALAAARELQQPVVAQPPSPVAPSGPQPDDAPAARAGEAAAGQKEPVPGVEWEPQEYLEPGSPMGSGRERKWTVDTPRGKVEVVYNGDKWGSRLEFMGAGIQGVKKSRISPANRSKYKSPADAAEKLIAEYQSKSKKNAEVSAEGPREVRHSPEFIKTKFQARDDFMHGPNWSVSGVKTLRNAALKGIPYTIEADEVTDYGGKLVLRIANQRIPLTKGKVNQNDLGLYLGRGAGIYGPVASQPKPEIRDSRTPRDFVLKQQPEPLAPSGVKWVPFTPEGELVRGYSAETPEALEKALRDGEAVQSVTVEQPKRVEKPEAPAGAAEKQPWEMPWREYVAANKITTGGMKQARREYVAAVRRAQEDGNPVSEKVLTDVESVQRYLDASEEIQSGAEAPARADAEPESAPPVQEVEQSAPETDVGNSAESYVAGIKNRVKREYAEKVLEWAKKGRKGKAPARPKFLAAKDGEDVIARIGDLTKAESPIGEMTYAGTAFDVYRAEDGVELRSKKRFDDGTPLQTRRMSMADYRAEQAKRENRSRGQADRDMILVHPDHLEYMPAFRLVYGANWTAGAGRGTQLGDQFENVRVGRSPVGARPMHNPDGPPFDELPVWIEESDDPIIKSFAGLTFSQVADIARTELQEYMMGKRRRPVEEEWEDQWPEPPDDWEEAAESGLELVQDGEKLASVESDLEAFFSRKTADDEWQEILDNAPFEPTAEYSVRSEKVQQRLAASKQSRAAFEALPKNVRDGLVAHGVNLHELGYRTEPEMRDALVQKFGEKVAPVSQAVFESVRAIEKKLDEQRAAALRGQEAVATRRPGIQLANGARLPVPREIISAGKYGKELDEHQRLGANMALTRFNKAPGTAFGLFDGQGTGKTRIILVAAAEWAASSGKPSLIIAPSRQVIEQVYMGDAEKLSIGFDDIEIGTYDDLRLGKVGKDDYGVVVFDEAHFLKNVHSIRASAAAGVTADHRMFATGTPMDRPTAAAYFLSHLTGLTEKEVQRQLGYEVIETTVNGEVKRYAQTLQGVSWQAVWQNIVKMRNEMIERGAMIRREFPFFGSFDSATIPSNPALDIEQNEIDAYWVQRIARAFSPAARKNLAGQRIGELSRWNEPRKLNWVFDAIQKDLADGRSVVVLAEGVNDTELKSIGEMRPGFLSELSKMLRSAGIKHARVYGTSNKALEIRKFQSGEVRVAIGTPGSAGTGVSMDDTSGEAPRTMYVVTQNWSGDLADQMLYRVSRRNTVTPARIVFVRVEGALADARRTQVVDAKIKTLEAIQQGVDPDEAAGWHPEADGAAPVTQRTGGERPSAALRIQDRDGGRLIELSGDTYPLRDRIRALKDELRDGMWHRGDKVWTFRKENEDAVRRAFAAELGEGQPALFSADVPEADIENMSTPDLVFDTKSMLEREIDSLREPARQYDLFRPSQPDLFDVENMENAARRDVETAAQSPVQEALFDAVDTAVEQMDAVGPAAADEWLAGVVADIEKLKAEHTELLFRRNITDTFRKAVASGRMTQEQYDAAVARGAILDEADYNKATGIEKRIEEIRNRPMEKPQREPQGRTAPVEKPPRKPQQKSPRKRGADPEAIVDFGEKIGGARKDVWKSRGLSTADIERMTDREAYEYTTKDNIWPKIDYKAMVEAGADPVAAFLVKRIRDGIPVKPDYYLANDKANEELRRQYLEAVSGLRDAIRDVKTVEDVQGVFARLFAGKLDVEKNPYTGRETRKLTTEGAAWSRTLGRNAMEALQISAYDVVKAGRAIEKTGWPEPREAWQTQFEIKKFDKDDTFTVVKGFRILETGFPTREAAVEWAREHAKPKQKGNTGIVRPELAHIQRVGVDYRGGKDAGTDDLLQVFGFRGGEFGNWTNQQDRRQNLNHAFDALMDLARVLNLPPKAISLNGELGIAFGARGHGDAAAHYEPARVVINLTKTSGAGALAHEWAHAVDDYLGRVAWESARGNYMSETHARPAASKLRPEVTAAVKRVVDAIKSIRQTPEEAAAAQQGVNNRLRTSFESWISSVQHSFGLGRRIYDRRAAGNVREIKATPEQTARMKELAAELMANPSRENADAVVEHYKAVLGAMPEKTARDQLGILAGILASQRENPQPPKQYLRDTKFYTGAKALDKSRAKPYWSTERELFARALEAYVYDQITTSGRSDYLVHGVRNEDYQGKDAYPAGEERERINEAFRDLFNTLQTRETEKGIAIYEPEANYGGIDHRKELRDALKSIAAGEKYTSPGQLAGHVIAGKTPAFLRALGHGNEIMVALAEKMREAMTRDEDHDFTPEEIAAMLEALDTPIQVFRSKTRNRYVFHVAVDRGKKAVVVVVGPNEYQGKNSDGTIRTGIAVVSIHSRSRGATQLHEWTEGGLLLYRDDAAAAKWFSYVGSTLPAIPGDTKKKPRERSSWVQFPESASEAVTNLLRPNDIVKYLDENSRKKVSLDTDRERRRLEKSLEQLERAQAEAWKRFEAGQDVSKKIEDLEKQIANVRRKLDDLNAGRVAERTAAYYAQSQLNLFQPEVGGTAQVEYVPRAVVDRLKEKVVLAPIITPSGVQYHARELYRGIQTEFEVAKTASLLGQYVATPADLAQFAQHFRRPDIEVFRVFGYDANGKCIVAEAVTTRQINMVELNVDWCKEISEKLVAAGAVTYDLLHNHPSGELRASREDLAMTAAFANDLPIPMRSHVVTNHGKYVEMRPLGEGEVPPEGAQESTLTTPYRVVEGRDENGRVGYGVFRVRVTGRDAEPVGEHNNKTEAKVRAFELNRVHGNRTAYAVVKPLGRTPVENPNAASIPNPLIDDTKIHSPSDLATLGKELENTQRKLDIVGASTSMRVNAVVEADVDIINDIPALTGLINRLKKGGSASVMLVMDSVWFKEFNSRLHNLVYNGDLIDAVGLFPENNAGNISIRQSGTAPMGGAEKGILERVAEPLPQDDMFGAPTERRAATAPQQGPKRSEDSLRRRLESLKEERAQLRRDRDELRKERGNQAERMQQLAKLRPRLVNIEREIVAIEQRLDKGLFAPEDMQATLFEPGSKYGNERIVAAAWRDPESGMVHTGSYHGEIYDSLGMSVSAGQDDLSIGIGEGFVTNTGRFVYRKEAGQIAYKAGQTKNSKPADAEAFGNFEESNRLNSRTPERAVDPEVMQEVLKDVPREFVERVQQDPNLRDRGYYNPITDEIVTRMANGTATLHELGHRFWLRYAPQEMHNSLLGLVDSMDRIIGKKPASEIRASYPRNEWAFEMEAEMFRQVAEKKEWAWTRARAFAGRLFRMFPKAFRRWGIDAMAKLLFGAYRMAQRAMTVLARAGARQRSAIAEFLAGKRAYGKHDPAVRRPQARLSENVMMRLAEHGRRLYGEGKQTMSEMIDALAQAYGDQVRPFGPAIYRRTIETLSRRGGGQLGVFEREYAIPAETRMKAFQRAIQDRFNRMLAIERAVSEQGGSVVRGENPYMMEELHYGKIETRLEDFEKEHVVPLKKALAAAQKAGISMEDVSEYLYAVHAPDRNAQIAKINPEMPDGGSGMYDEEARQIIERMRTEGKLGAEMDAAARAVWGINKAARDIIRGNLEKDETVDAWEEMYGEHYVPLRTGETDHLGDQAEKAISAMGTGRGFSVSRSGVKRALGRRSLAGNIIEHSLQQYINAVVRDEKNRVGRAFLDMVLANPDRSLWEISKVPMKRVLTRDGVVAMVPDMNATYSEEYFRVTVDGEVKFVHVKDPILARQLKRLYEGDLVGPYGRAIVNTLGRFTRYVTVINTAMNPEFLFVNFVRDAQAAGVNMSADGLGKLVGKVAKSTPRAISGIMSAEFADGKGEWAGWYDRFKRAGGKVAFFKMDQVEEIQKKLIADVNALALSKAENVLRHPWRSIARPLVEGITKMNGAIENGVRLAAFRALVEAGASEPIAASYAKNMTVNFNRKGELGPIMNSLYAFFNAGVQGQARMLQTLKSGRGKMLAAGMLLAGILWSELQRVVGGEDEDGLNRYDKVDPYVKSTSVVIMLPESMRKPGAPEYVKMPLPYGLGLFYSLGAEINAVAHGKPVISRSMDDGEWVDGAVPDFFSAMATHMNPLGNGPLLQVLMPTGMEPFMQMYTNENFFGAPIRPEPKSWDDPKPASEMYFQNARPASRWLARRINEVSGGDEFTPGYVSVSPNDIDFMFDFLTGGAGKFWFNTAQMLGNFLSGEGTPVENVPVARRFVGREREGATRDRFYAIFDEYRRLDSQADAIRNDEIRYQQFLRDNQRFVDFAKAIDDRPQDDLRIPRRLDWIQRDLSKLGRDERAARKNGEHARADELHQKQMRIMKEVIRIHNQYMEQK